MVPEAVRIAAPESPCDLTGAAGPVARVLALSSQPIASVFKHEWFIVIELGI
jgi:hypothetical protein